MSYMMYLFIVATYVMLYIVVTDIKYMLPSTSIYACPSFNRRVTCIFNLSLPGLFVLSQESDPPPRIVQSKGDASRGPLLLF